MAQNENISLSLANKVDILNRTQSVDARYGVYETEEDALEAMDLYGLDGRQVAVYSDKDNGKVKLYLYNKAKHQLEPISGEYISELTGDVTASGSGSVVATITDEAVTQYKLASSSVTQGKIASHAVVQGKIATGAVTTAKIQDLSITPDKLASASVTNEKLADNSINSSKLQANSVTTQKIQGGTPGQVLTTDESGNVSWQDGGGDSIPISIFSQYSESSILGDSGVNLIQPDLGLPILEVDDLQEDSSYSGELVLNIENNNTATAKVIELFGAEIYNNTNPSADITAKITFTLDFFNQVGDDIDYKLSWEYAASGEVLFGEHVGTIDNTSNVDFELIVTGHSTDEFNLRKARLWRN